MAITFTQERKKQRYLILALIFVLALIVFVWRGLLQKDESPGSESGEQVVIPIPSIGIDLKFFQDPIWKELEDPPEPVPFPERLGRENPFVPYELPQE